MAHSYTNLLYHIVFGTKERQPWLDDRVRQPVIDFLAAGIVAQGGITLAVNAVADHVHILAKLRPDLAVSEILRDVKARSSGWLHAHFPASHEGFAWQTGYGAFSVSRSQSERVRAYIQNQEEHHRHQSFGEEFIALLDKHGVEYDARYLWT